MLFDLWVDELKLLDLVPRGRSGVCDVAAGVTRMRAALDSVDARVAVAVESLGDGGIGAAATLRGAGRVSQREADRKARRADALRELPAAALSDGLITAEHVDVLARAAEKTSPEAVEASGLLKIAKARPADMAAKDTRDWTRREQSAASAEATAKRLRAARRCVVFPNDDGTAEISGYGPIPTYELDRLACTSDLFGLVFDSDAQPLWHGRKKRLATNDQRRASIARDGGRVICNAEPSRCEAHHIIFWDGPQKAPTDISDLALVCKHHHHQIHDSGTALACRNGLWTLEAVP